MENHLRAQKLRRCFKNYAVAATAAAIASDDDAIYRVRAFQFMDIERCSSCELAFVELMIPSQWKSRCKNRRLPYHQAQRIWSPLL